MFACYFLNKEWRRWCWGGMAVVVAGTWFQVQLNVQINTWFGGFYDLVQKALAENGHVSEDAYYAYLYSFGQLASAYVVTSTLLAFFTKHWVFRWRQAMNNYYMVYWSELRRIEGASQRVQEDTRRFAMIMESLGASLLQSMMTLVAFLPVLWNLSKSVEVLPFFGRVNHGLVYVAILLAASGSVMLGAVGMKLPGLEFNNQMVEAAFRKELVFGEEDEEHAEAGVVKDLWLDLRVNYFRLFFHYTYFDLAKYSYLQFSVILPYVALGPTLVNASITLGDFQQILGCFSQVENSFQFLVLQSSTIVELMSVFKRLRAFGSCIPDTGDWTLTTDVLMHCPAEDGDAL